MTDREIKSMEMTLPRWENGKPPVLTEEQKRISEELSCRRMINSILIYHGSREVQEDSYRYQLYLKKYEEILGRSDVLRLCAEQLEDFQKAVVSFAGWDHEGVSYNSIMWADEMVDACLGVVLNELNELEPDNGVGYTVPDGKYHIFIYLDVIDDEKVFVLEPNKVVHGAHEPIFGDTFIAAFNDIAALRDGIDWCLSEFAMDRHGLDAVLRNAHERSGVTAVSNDIAKDFLLE